MGSDENAPEQSERARRRRNVAIAIALGALVVLFFVMTMVRLKGHVLNFFQ